MARQNKVAVYVQAQYAKPAYSVESYNVRAWPGLELVCDALRRAGIEVDYCSSATVSRYDVILISITSACDWYAFLPERVRWREHGIVIAGGAGVLNVRPFLEYVDVFCFGRAEDFIVPLVTAALAGERHNHPSVCYSAEFDVNRTYVISSGRAIYPHEVRLANGKVWRESAIGCQRKCLFCSYTWHRRHIGGLQSHAGAGDALWAGAAEKTIFELDLPRPETWGLRTLRMVGLDGFSERLRRMVNKPITRKMLRAFLTGLGRSGRSGKMKIYNLVGLPTETEEDWAEFVEDVAAADAELPVGDQRWGLVLHSTPFRAMPATPAACWPMSCENYRGRIATVLRQGRQYKGGIFFQGKRLWCVESKGTESLPTSALEALALRGVEDDAEVLARLATNRNYRTARVAQKTAILERHVDMDRLFGAYTWADLPTRYLQTYISHDKLQRIEARSRKDVG